MGAITTTTATTELVNAIAIMTMPTATILSALHSNTNFRLYILRNIYSKGISIKEIYSFRKGKKESVKQMLVTKVNISVLRIKMEKKMNICFIIGKIVEDIKFDFMLNRIHNSIVQFKIKDERKNNIKIVGYDKIADYCYKNLKKNDTVIIEGKIGNLKNSMVIMIINCIKL